MPGPVHLDRILERSNDRALTDDILEGLGAELTRDDLILHSGRQMLSSYLVKGPVRRPGPGDTVSHRVTHYRCFLPDLAGFAGADCTAPLRPDNYSVRPRSK